MKQALWKRVPGILIFAALLAAAAAAHAEPQMQQGFIVAVFEGAPADMGRQQGELLKDQVQRIYKEYLNDLFYNDWVKMFAMLKGMNKVYKNPHKDVTQFAETTLPFIPEEYVEEMQALADAGGVPFREVLNLTAHVDYMSLLLCSTAVAAGDATGGRGLVMARNLDWAEGEVKSLDALSSLLVYRPEEGHAFVSILYPGMVGALSAVNDAQIAVELNYVETTHNRDTGFPALLLVRHIAQHADSLDQAEALLRQAPVITGYNVVVADGKTGRARLFELSGDAMAVVDMSADDTLVATNHFTSPDLAPFNVPDERQYGLRSIPRYDRLHELLGQNYSAVDAAAAAAMVHDPGVRAPSTMQSFVFDPAADRLLVWSRTRAPGDFAEFKISELLNTPAQ